MPAAIVLPPADVTQWAQGRKPDLSLREIGAVLLIGVSTAFLAAERRSRDQGIQWIAGSGGLWSAGWLRLPVSCAPDGFGAVVSTTFSRSPIRQSLILQRDPVLQ